MFNGHACSAKWQKCLPHRLAIKGLRGSLPVHEQGNSADKEWGQEQTSYLARDNVSMAIVRGQSVNRLLQVHDINHRDRTNHTCNRGQEPPFFVSVCCCCLFL